MSFQINLKKYRESKGLSQEDLAQLLGVGQSTVGMWENGVNMPRMKTLQRITEILEITTNDLMGTSNNNYSGSSTNKDNITFDDFTYAMHNEAKELTEKDKEMLLNMARMLRERINDDKTNGGLHGTSK